MNPASHVIRVLFCATILALLLIGLAYARPPAGADPALAPYFESLMQPGSGLTLSNDATSPTTVLDIAAGQCSDSTNSVTISLGAFTKSTGGSWAAGSGHNGMGAGLTIANSTWYHVFAIVNAGSPDVYFDTSVTAAHAPSGTTAFRRIGSFLTNGSAQIIAFSQDGPGCPAAIFPTAAPLKSGSRRIIGKPSSAPRRGRISARRRRHRMLDACAGRPMHGAAGRRLKWRLLPFRYRRFQYPNALPHSCIMRKIEK